MPHFLRWARQWVRAVTPRCVRCTRSVARAAAHIYLCPLHRAPEPLSSAWLHHTRAAELPARCTDTVQLHADPTCTTCAGAPASCHPAADASDVMLLPAGGLGRARRRHAVAHEALELALQEWRPLPAPGQGSLCCASCSVPCTPQGPAGPRTARGASRSSPPAAACRGEPQRTFAHNCSRSRVARRRRRGGPRSASMDLPVPHIQRRSVISLSCAPWNPRPDDKYDADGNNQWSQAEFYAYILDYGGSATFARALKSETTTVDASKFAPASLQVLSWPSSLTDTPHSLLSDRPVSLAPMHVHTPACVIHLLCCPLCCVRTTRSLNLSLMQ